MIIDAHTHIYPDKIAAKASENIGAFYDLYMHFNGSIGTLLSEGRAAGIDRFLVCSVATTPAQVARINDFIAGSVREHPEFIGFATLHPDMENMEEEVERIISMGLKGVKLHSDFQQFLLDEPRAMKIYELLEGRLPLLVHAGDKRYEYSKPHRIARVARAFPGLKLIAAHFGGYSEWDDAEKELSGTGVYVDTSSALFALTKEKALSLIDMYGEDKVFFGTDYPMWDAAEELERFRALGLPEDISEMILHKNLENLLGL